MTTQLCRSRTDSMIGGVCGGLAQTLAIDAVIIRLFFVLLTLGGGAGVLIYFILWIIMPLEGEGAFGSKDTARAGLSEIADHARTTMGNPESTRQADPQRTLVIGITLVLIGAVVLLRNLGMPWMAWMHMSTIWPLLLIIGGIAMIARRTMEA
jgi:phage shock protein C